MLLEYGVKDSVNDQVENLNKTKYYCEQYSKWYAIHQYIRKKPFLDISKVFMSMKDVELFNEDHRNDNNWNKDQFPQGLNLNNW